VKTRFETEAKGNSEMACWQLYGESLTVHAFSFNGVETMNFGQAMANKHFP